MTTIDKPISEKDLKRIVVKAYLTKDDLIEFKDSIVDAINSLVRNDFLEDLSIVQRTETKWNIILTFENDKEFLYNIDMNDLLNI